MFIPLKMVLIGIDPYPNGPLSGNQGNVFFLMKCQSNGWVAAHQWRHQGISIPLGAAVGGTCGLITGAAAGGAVDRTTLTNQSFYPLVVTNSLQWKPWPVDWSLIYLLMVDLSTSRTVAWSIQWMVSPIILGFFFFGNGNPNASKVCSKSINPHVRSHFT